MKVWLIIKDDSSPEWKSTGVSEYARIPVVGEFVATSFDSPWYEVLLVVHTPSSSKCDAEVYAEEVDAMTVKKAALLRHQ